MAKCQTCDYYSYHAGVAPTLAKMIGNTSLPNRPTCYCRFANVAWERYSAEVRKPRGIPCDYKIKKMTCTDCGKELKNHRDAYMVLTPTAYICKKCMSKEKLEKVTP